MTIPRVFMALSLAAFASLAQAEEVSSSQLVGIWCSGAIVYAFTPQGLTVLSLTNHAQREFPIASATAREGWIYVDFGQGRTSAFRVTDDMLVQARNTEGDMGPERHFRRCDWPSGQ